MDFLIVVIDYDASHKYAEKIMCCFGCGLEKRSMRKLMSFFLRKYSCKNYIVKIAHPPLQTYSENMGQKFSISF
jgi:hypothetical protein